MEDIKLLLEKVLSKVSALEDIVGALSDGMNAPPLKYGYDRCAEETGLQRSTLRSMVSKGDIPYIRERNKVYFFHKEIMAWRRAPHGTKPESAKRIMAERVENSII
ncbi:MAG: helix-turn-helix domain-containing protein [Bacteroidota bacterium]